jgi:hypothetical protein
MACTCQLTGVVEPEHHHKCNGCGHVWAHKAAEGMCRECYQQRHTCPQCGQQNQRDKYYATLEEAQANRDWFYDHDLFLQMFPDLKEQAKAKSPVTAEALGDRLLPPQS